MHITVFNIERVSFGYSRLCPGYVARGYITTVKLLDRIDLGLVGLCGYVHAYISSRRKNR
jgi:hypothetical protein